MSPRKSTTQTTEPGPPNCLFVVRALVCRDAASRWNLVERAVASAIADHCAWNAGVASTHMTVGQIMRETDASESACQRALRALCGGRDGLKPVFSREVGGGREHTRFVLRLSIPEARAILESRRRTGASQTPVSAGHRCPPDTAGVSEERALKGILVPVKVQRTPPVPPARAGGNAQPITLAVHTRNVRREREAALEGLVADAARLGERPDRRTRRAWRERLATGAPAEELAAEIQARATERELERLRDGAWERLCEARTDPDAAASTWGLIADQLERAINAHSFATWFRPLAAWDLRAGRLLVQTPNAQFADWLPRNYGQAVAAAIAACGLTLRVEFTTAEQLIEADIATRAARPPAERLGGWTRAG